MKSEACKLDIVTFNKRQSSCPSGYKGDYFHLTDLFVEQNEFCSALPSEKKISNLACGDRFKFSN